MQIMNQVDILDLIKIIVYRPEMLKAGAFQVDLESLDKSKRVVLDEDAVKSLNEIITDKCQQFDDARDPKVAKYIEEFVAKMCSGWHRCGLLELEPIPDEPEDHYKRAKQIAGKLN